MAETKRKGDIGEAMIMADILRRGYKVAIPIGEDWKYDLIVLRHGKLERVQCKYVTSDGAIIAIPCRASYGGKSYTKNQVDWIAVYDSITEHCYYMPITKVPPGSKLLKLRIKAPKNNQHSHIRWAKDYVEF